MYLIDYHTHTYLCKHAEGHPEEFLAQAELAGLNELGIADHSPWPVGYDAEFRMAPAEYEIYRTIVKQLATLNSSVNIKYGLEIDWVPGRMTEVAKKLADEEFDYILGSVHYVENFAFDNPENLPQWHDRSKADWVWERYPDLLYDFVTSFDFDIIAHPDLPKKFNIYPSDYSRFVDGMNRVFTVAGQKNMSLEINTGGLRKTVREIYPTLQLLKSAREHGVTLTLGSDAHAPGQVAANFMEAVELAEQAGFNEIASYRKREKSIIPIQRHD